MLDSATRVRLDNADLVPVVCVQQPTFPFAIERLDFSEKSLKLFTPGGMLWKEFRRVLQTKIAAAAADGSRCMVAGTEPHPDATLASLDRIFREPDGFLYVEVVLAESLARSSSEVARLLARHPNRVPMSCRQKASGGLPEICTRMLAPRGTRCSELAGILRRYAVPEGASIDWSRVKVFVGGHPPPISETVGDIYERLKGEDDILHLTLSFASMCMHSRLKNESAIVSASASAGAYFGIEITGSNAASSSCDGFSVKQVENTFLCPICAAEESIEDIFFVQGTCGHHLCRVCARAHILMKLGEHQLPRCPCCSGPLADRSEITQAAAETVLEPAEIQNWFKLEVEAWSLSTVARTAQCATPDCAGFVEIDPELEESKWRCPVCYNDNCMRCNVKWHEGLSCAAFQAHGKDEDTKFEEWAETAGVRRCPRCQAPVLRAGGCPHMTCRCGHHFCYACGQERDPQRPYDHVCNEERGDLAQECTECGVALIYGRSGTGAFRGQWFCEGCWHAWEGQRRWRRFAAWQ